MKLEHQLNKREKFDFFYSQMIFSDKIMFAGTILKQSYERWPDNIALIYQDRFITYKELYYRAAVFSQKLIKHGLQPRERVLLFFRNSFEFYVAYFAVWQAGAVVAPLNIFLREKELKHIVKDANPSMIISAHDKIDLFKNVNAATLFTDKDMDLDSHVPELLPEFESVCLEPDELAALLYTSGTTGLPKGVMLSSKNIMTNVAQALSSMPFNQAQRVFCVLPLFHCFAQNTCIWSSLFAGCTVIVVPKISRKEILDSLKHTPTIFLGVPALFGLLCLFKDAPLSCIEYFISGGDALPDKIRSIFSLLYRRKLCNGYGLTETSPLISVDMDDLAEPTNNVGLPVIGMDCSIRDEMGNEVPQGHIGELWVKGDNVMMGYYNAPELTKEVIVEGWLATGDFARFDDYGKLIICGRLKDLIIHKGMNIYPQEIENVIVGHRAVLRVGVIGKDDLYGQVPIAVVQLRKKHKGVEKELHDLCQKELAAYKVPKKIIVIDDMPLTATGKVDKNKLRTQIFK